MKEEDYTCYKNHNPSQIQTTGKAKYSGPMDVIKQTYRESGLRGIMRGTVITAVRGGQRKYR